MYYKSRIFGAALALVLALVLAAFGAFSIRLAWADAEFRRNTPAGVERALELLPRNTAYLQMRALQVDYDGGDATPLLERAAALSPRSSAPRIRLGLAAEARGDFSSAEKWLLEAARLDRQFEPRWTLANFYFRAAGADDFWKWMHEALAISYGDRSPAFDLCWRMSEDADEILRRGIPERRDVLANYLGYMLKQHPRAAGPVALRLAEMQDWQDQPLLYTACDSLIDLGLADEARRLWALLSRAQPRAGNAVTNGDFALAPSGHGFDWRPAQGSGITHVQMDAGAGHRITLSGGQPESCQLMLQIAPAEPGRRYTLRWQSRSQGLKAPTGIAWSSANGSFPIGASAEWRKSEAVLTAPADLLPLTLVYQRPAGQARAEGSIELRGVELIPLP